MCFQIKYELEMETGVKSLEWKVSKQKPKYTTSIGSRRYDVLAPRCPSQTVPLVGAADYFSIQRGALEGRWISI